MARILVGLFIILLGISALTGLSLIKFAFALFLVLIGIRIMFDKGRKWDFGNKVSSSENYMNEVAIFSSLNKTIRSSDFRGGKISMIFAGGEIDLSEVKTDAKELDIEFVSIFGGGKLIVPKGWKINSEGTAIFGGYDVNIDRDGEGPTLNLKGAAVFGGIEVVNK